MKEKNETARKERDKHDKEVKELEQQAAQYRRECSESENSKAEISQLRIELGRSQLQVKSANARSAQDAAKFVEMERKMNELKKEVSF